MPQFLSSPEDMKWLLDTHCPNLNISWEPRSAMLIGNEDCPEEIHLWPARNPTLYDVPLIGTYFADKDEYIFAGPLTADVAMRIDARERDLSL